MEIDILGAESLGVRGLCCFIKTKNKKILIDPGIALGYHRYGLPPHPFQIAVDERIQKRILDRWKEATDIIISHYHGDHIPLKNANPYQLSLKKVEVKRDVSFWCKGSDSLSPTMLERYKDLSKVFKLKNAQGRNYKSLSFSRLVPHGEANNDSDTVMMTRIKEDNLVFVHASDIQLLNNGAIDKILSWFPNIVLASGPPLYLSEFSKNKIKTAWHNAERLSSKVDILILDHHLMRNLEGLKWLKRLSLKTGKKVICAADFMKKPRMLFEAKREQLYKDMPVPEGWHKDYARGKVNTKSYWNKAAKLYPVRNPANSTIIQFPRSKERGIGYDL